MQQHRHDRNKKEAERKTQDSGKQRKEKNPKKKKQNSTETVQERMKSPVLLRRAKTRAWLEEDIDRSRNQGCMEKTSRKGEETQERK